MPEESTTDRAVPIGGTLVRDYSLTAIPPYSPHPGIG